MKFLTIILAAMILLTSEVESGPVGFITDEAQATSPAWEWVDANHEALFLQPSDIRENGLPSGLSSIWWHGRMDATLDPDMLHGNTINHLKDFLEQGGGMLLSGFPTQYVVNLGVEDTPPGAVFPEPTTSGNWGLTPMVPGHPIFAGFVDTPILTLSSGNAVRNVISWWEDPSRLNGRWIADNEGRIDRVALAEYALGKGKILAIGTGAYDWHVSPSDNAHRGNLERLTDNMLAYIGTPWDSSTPSLGMVAHWDFAEGDGHGEVIDQISGTRSPVHHNFDSPERVELPGGTSAMIFDGYSTWFELPGNHSPMVYDAMTVSLWVAPRSYPVEMAGIINQYNDNEGYILALTRYGQWGFRLNIGGMWHAIWAPEQLPLNAWSHVAATYRQGDGLKLFLNGEQVSHVPTFDGRVHLALGEPLRVGRNLRGGAVAEIFPTAVYIGMMADLQVHRTALGREEIQSQVNAAQFGPGPAPFIQVPARRFANDPHRPVYHALPEADWTNEPHGLVQDSDGVFHMFYQKNPAGPYWSFIHWGHMTSTDLVNWKHEPNALAPRPGYSQYGMWSGDAAIEDGKIRLVFTAVDGARAVVGIADREEGADGPFHLHESNPVIDGRPRGEALLDYRDPYVWKNPGEDHWNLVIGAGVPGVGGTSLIYTSDKLDGPWEYHGHFFSGLREFNGDFWEMPVVIHFDEEHVWYGVSELPAINTYWVGKIEGHRFVPNNERSKNLEVINHLLSPTVTRDDQGRWVSIAIIPETRSSQEQLNAGWAHVYSIPRVWSLDTENQLLIQSPHPNLQSLRGEPHAMGERSVPEGETWSDSELRGAVAEVELRFDIRETKRFDVLLRRDPQGREETRLRIDAGAGTLILDRTKSSLNEEVQRDIREGTFHVGKEDELTLRVFLDNSVVECFINDRDAFATRVYPTLGESVGVAVEAVDGEVRINSATHWPMGSARMKYSTIEEFLE